MAKKIDVFEGIGDVRAGNVDDAFKFFVNKWEATKGDVGDEIVEALVSHMGPNADELQDRVVAYVEEWEKTNTYV